MRLSTVMSALCLGTFAATAPALAADLVSLAAHVTNPTANPGGANEGACFVSNTTNGSVRVRLDVRVIYSNGKVERLTGIPDPGVLPAGGAFEQDVFFVIPVDASLGTATWVCDVTAQSLVQRNQRETEAQSATFDVVP